MKKSAKCLVSNTFLTPTNKKRYLHLKTHTLPQKTNRPRAPKTRVFGNILHYAVIPQKTHIAVLLRDSFKDILQELMEAELDATLGYEKNCKGDLQTDNKRNGHSPKKLKSQYGEFQIDVPRDRNGEFEPKLIPKYQRDISGIEDKVISLYARGMSTRDIHDQLNDLYGIDLSAEMVSNFFNLSTGPKFHKLIIAAHQG